MPPSARLRLAPEPVEVTDAYRRLSRYVARLGFRLLGRDEELDDLVQDVFLAATKARLMSGNEHELRGWLATVTVRLCGRRLRRRRLARFLNLDDGPAEQLRASSAPLETVLFVNQLFHRLDAMPSAERLAWSLRYLEDEPLERVAALCGVSLATAKRRIAAVQQRLRDAGEGGWP